MTCVQQIAFPLGLSDLERFNQRQLRYPTIVLLQLTLAPLEPLRSNQPSFFLQDFFPFLQSNRSHNRARSSSNQSIARLFFFFKSHALANSNTIHRFVRTPAEGRRHYWRGTPIVFQGSIISSVAKTMEFSTDY